MLSPIMRFSISLCVSVFPCLMPARSASLLFLLNMFPLTYFIAHRRLAKIRIKSSTNKKAIPFYNKDTALIANINAVFCVVPLRNHSTGGSYPKPALNKIFLWFTIEWRGVRRLSYPRRIAHCSKKLQKGRSSNIICGFVFRRPQNMGGRLKMMGFRFRERWRIGYSDRKSVV